MFAGYTDQFEDIWKGSTTDPAQIVVALLPGFVTYAGWLVFTFFQRSNSKQICYHTEIRATK